MPPPSLEISEAMRTSAPARLISVDEFHRMVASGIIDEDEHVELIEGVLVAMTPQSAPHARVIHRLNFHFARTLPEHLRVTIQSPLTLGDWSEPEPDFAVVTREEAEREDSHPTSALLVVEVARSTLRKDRAKAALYAEHGIPEYWIVNEADGCIEVRRDPDPAAKVYRSVFTVRAGERLQPASVPAPEVDVAALLG